MSTRVPFLPLLPTDKSNITLLRLKKIHDSHRLHHPLISEQLWIEKSQDYNSYIHGKIPKEIEFIPFELNDVQNADYILYIRNHLDKMEKVLLKTPEFPYISPSKTTMTEKLSQETLDSFLPLIKMPNSLTLPDGSVRTTSNLSENLSELEYYKVDPFSFIREDVCDVFLSLYEIPDLSIEGDTNSNTIYKIENDSITRFCSDLTDESLLHTEIVDYVLLSNPEGSNNSREENVMMRDNNNNNISKGVETNNFNDNTVFYSPKMKKEEPQSLCSDKNPNRNSVISLTIEDQFQKLKSDIDVSSSIHSTDAYNIVKAKTVLSEEEIITKLPVDISCMKETPKHVVASSDGGSNSLFVKQSIDDFCGKSRNNIVYETEFSIPHSEQLQISSSTNNFLNKSNNFDSSITNEDIFIKRKSMNDDLNDENVLLLSKDLIKDQSYSMYPLNNLEKEKLHEDQTNEISEQKDIRTSKKYVVDSKLKSVYESPESSEHPGAVNEQCSPNINLNLFRDETELKDVKNTDYNSTRANESSISEECVISQPSFLEGQSCIVGLDNSLVSISSQEMSYSLPIRKSFYPRCSKDENLSKTADKKRDNFNAKKDSIDSNFKSICKKKKYDIQPFRIKKPNYIHDMSVGCPKDKLSNEISSHHSSASLGINEFDLVLQKSRVLRRKLSSENCDIEAQENKSFYFEKKNKKVTTIGTQSPYFQSKIHHKCQKNKRLTTTQAPFSLNTLKCIKRMSLSEKSTNPEEKLNQITHEDVHICPIGSKSKESGTQMKESSSSKRKMKRTKVIPNFNF